MIAIENNIKKSKNPFLLFLPFLLLYLILILIFSTNEITGDEGRYTRYAENLLKGFYSPPPPAIDLGNGPGYPIVLVPFVALGLPLIFIKLLNAVFYYLSVVLLFKSLQKIVPLKFSVVFSLIWALYPAFYEKMIFTLPEVFVQSLILLFIFCSINAFNHAGNKKAGKYIFFSGIVLGYIALTKPIFGYVIMFMIAGAFLLFMVNRKNFHYKKTLTIMAIAFITTIPYLAYTYHLTGKMFYWSSYGGNNLYWMSSPYEGEYGDWMEFPPSPTDKYRIPGSDKLITLKHQKDYDFMLQNKEVKELNEQNGEIKNNLLIGLAQDDLFKSLAIRNIKSHPGKFILNCISNAGRMIFNYPASYVLQKPTTLRRLPINGTLLVVFLFCMVPSLANWRKILFPLRFVLFLAAIYFGGSLLGSADIRMFAPVVPILLIWIAYTLSKSVRINMNWGKADE